MIFRKFRLPLSDQLSTDANYNFKIDITASCMFGLFNVVFNQFYVPMAIDAGASNIQVGLLSASSAIGLLLSPLWASLIERTSPKPFMMYPNLIGRLLILLPAFFGAPIVFVMTALLFQILMGIQAPAYASLMTRVYPVNYRGRLMGYVRVAMGLLMIPLAYLVGYWSDAYGSSGPLAAASITGVIGILIFFNIRVSEIKPSHQPIATKRASLKEQWQLVRQNRELGIFLLATTLSGFGNILSQPLFQLIQKEELQLSFQEIGFARTTYFIFLLCSYFIIGSLIDKYSPYKILTFGIAAFAIVPMLYGLSESYPVVIIGSGIQGIGDAIWDIGILAYVFRLAPGREAVVFGLHLLLFGIRGTIGPLLSTGLADVLPYSSMLLVASLFGWIGVAVFIKGNLKQLR